MLRTAALVFLAFNTFACGVFKPKDSKNKSTTHSSLQGRDFIVLDGANLTTDADLLHGTGVVVFTLPLDKTKTSANFKLNVNIKDGGSVELVSFADAKLDRGVAVRFAQSANALTLSVAKGHANIASVKPKTDTELSVDIHADEKPAHTLVWTDMADVGHEEHAAFNSEDFAEWSQTATDQFWGLKLVNAGVKEATPSDAKVEHEHEHEHEH